VMCDKMVAKLMEEKLNVKDFTPLQDKVHKLEGSMKDNRTILSDGGGGQDVSAVVKRIILNLEDKIMVIEKRVEALIERRALDAENMSMVTQSPSDFAPSRSQTASADLAAMQTLSVELQNMGQAVGQLRQDINVSRVDIDQIAEHGHQQVELAQRLNVLVEGASGESGETGGTTTLSLNRVQVMVSAAARQLVAGSKWITKETFDLRYTELRKEASSSTRQLQTQMEELQSLVSRAVALGGNSNVGSANPSTAKLPKMLVKRGAGDEGESLEWPEVPGDRLYDKAGARNPRPGTHLGAPGMIANGNALTPRTAPSPRGPGRPGTRG